MLNKLDELLQGVCPCVMVPRYEELSLLENDGHRFLIGSNALHVEVHRPWLHAILKVVDSPVPLPYGQPPQVFSINIQRKALVGGLQHFIRRARDVSPQEHAAWLTFDPNAGTLGYVEPEVIARGTEHIQYHRPDATASCLPAVDCHSHGLWPAYFSHKDERDDRSDDAKLAFVVGSLSKARPTIAMRFVGFGLALDLSEWVRPLIYSNGLSTDASEDDEHEFRQRYNEGV